MTTSRGDEQIGVEGSNPNPRFESEMEGRSKRLVEMELDAARALAGMAKIEVGSEEGGKSSRKRFKKESKARASRESSHDLNISRSEPAYPVDDYPQDNKAIEAVVEERTKVKQNSVLSISNISCSSSHVSCFGRIMKQNVTEAEREARRIRRVLANRESARQTIRRRQALREELIKRVADLLLENKNMQVEKELRMKEYLSLKDRNKELKDQMANAIKSEVEFGVGITSRHVATSTSTPSTELSLVAPSRASITVWDPGPSISSNAAACYEEGGSSGVGASKTLLYVPPCAWFYPLSLQASECYSPCLASTDKAADFIASQHGLRHCPQEGDNSGRASLHVGSKTDDLSTETAAPDEEKRNVGINLEEMPIGYDAHDISEHIASAVLTHSEEAVNPCPDVKGVQGVDTIADSMTDQLGTVEASAAAAARKRMKELAKLKYHHWWQIRLHG